MTTKRRKTGREDIIGPGIDEERDEKIREEEEGGGKGRAAVGSFTQKPDATPPPPLLPSISPLCWLPRQQARGRKREREKNENTKKGR